MIKLSDYVTRFVARQGVKHVFFTRPAGHAAGMFDVTVTAAGEWTGKSLDGSTLEAQQQGVTIDGFVRSASATSTSSATTTSPAAQLQPRRRPG